MRWASKFTASLMTVALQSSVWERYNSYAKQHGLHLRHTDTNAQVKYLKSHQAWHVPLIRSSLQACGGNNATSYWEVMLTCWTFDLQGSDLVRLLEMYERWQHNLFPSLSFDDFVAGVEKIGRSSEVKVLH